MRRFTPVLFPLLLVLVMAPPVVAVIPEGGFSAGPVPDAPSAPPTLAAVIELLKKGDAAAALKGAREFVKSQPGSALGHEVHGIAAMANRAAREAQWAFSQALRLEPGRLSAMVRLGQVALDAGDSQQAEGWFRKALAADPDLGTARRGLAVVRRPTGGRAVWHARELTYAVAAPLVGFGGLKAAYRAIHEMLAGALRRLGLNARLAPASVSPGPSAGPCFAAPVGGEVLVEGHKVVGSAQVRQGSAFLQHGSMLLEDDQALVRGLAGSSQSSAEAPVARLLQRQVTFAEAADAVAAAAGSFPGEWLLRQDLPGAVEERAGFHASRFRSPAWTWDR